MRAGAMTLSGEIDSRRGNHLQRDQGLQCGRRRRKRRRKRDVATSDEAATPHPLRPKAVKRTMIKSPNCGADQALGALGRRGRRAASLRHCDCTMNSLTSDTKLELRRRCATAVKATTAAQGLELRKRCAQHVVGSPGIALKDAPPHGHAHRQTSPTLARVWESAAPFCWQA